MIKSVIVLFKSGNRYNNDYFVALQQNICFIYQHKLVKQREPYYSEAITQFFYFLFIYFNSNPKDVVTLSVWLHNNSRQETLLRDLLRSQGRGFDFRTNTNTDETCIYLGQVWVVSSSCFLVIVQGLQQIRNGRSETDRKELTHM